MCLKVDPEKVVEMWKEKAAVSHKSECSGWALLVNPDYVQGRGQWAAPNHRGYTMDWKKAGRFSRVEAQDAERCSSGKYTAIPIQSNDQAQPPCA